MSSLQARPSNALRRFIDNESSGGIVLIACTIVALLLANTHAHHAYHHFLEQMVTIGFGHWSLSLTLHHWINDGLMAVFFFVVGLEIKREILTGELSSVKKASLPIIAAIGGMILPATIYVLLNKDPEAASGWGIPMATDIAFSLGVLSLLGKRVPLSLKVFLMTFAIVDDLGAVLVIAIFYTADLQLNYLLIGLALYAILVVFNFMKIRTVSYYIVIGIVIWYMFLQSGIHATIAGVLVAFAIPNKRRIGLAEFKAKINAGIDYFIKGDDNINKNLEHHQLEGADYIDAMLRDAKSPLQSLEHKLHQMVAFVIMPIFALANAGVVFGDGGISTMFSGVALNIELGLVVGKIFGILILCFLAVKVGIAMLPDNVKWVHIMGLGMLGGMGFTMSLFVSNLAFTNADLLNGAKMGILIGSLIAAILGYITLSVTLKKTNIVEEEQH